MKTILTVFSLALSVFFTNAQTTPEAFLGILPNPPGNVCSENEDDAKSAFIKEIEEIHKKLDAEISRRNKEMEAKMKVNADQMKQNAMAQTGISPELIQQLMALEKQSKGATGDQAKAYEAKKKALADQMMQQSTNISMGEIENLKKMDKEGKAAWAEAYATEKGAEVMADPQAYQQKSAEGMRDFQLVQKQKHLADSLNAQLMKYLNQFQDLDNNKDAQALVTQIKELEEKLNKEYQKEDRPNDDEIKSLIDRIITLQNSYCNMQSSKYLEILSRYKAFINASMTPYYRLEKLTNQVTASQTGVEIDVQPGLMGLQQVASYLNRLKDVYKYYMIKPLYISGVE